ncbi:SH3 domain-containing protein [Seinonella peptonophila]|uniref:SH3 domain-containing protein n=1 Tax=Seinonella peptonophila TaxID=112248 RepID=A0A1M4XHR6_9BACL|nr:M23 family metallopeptidase [Seinonella peptonophila]SHE92853.1 SH3 domain-containing protein [Seinonella peptonophila]
MKKISSLFASFVLIVSLLTVTLPNQTNAAGKPNFLLPFPCKEQWEGKTYAIHNNKPSVDFYLAFSKELSDGTRVGTKGKTVVASAAGKVIYAQNMTLASNQGTGYGNVVKIDHGDGWVSLYAHLDTIDVKNGASVKAGDKIGTVGNTTRIGNHITPHLHFEQFYNGVSQAMTLEGKGVPYSFMGSAKPHGTEGKDWWYKTEDKIVKLVQVYTSSNCGNQDTSSKPEEKETIKKPKSSEPIDTTQNDYQVTTLKKEEPLKATEQPKKGTEQKSDGKEYKVTTFEGKPLSIRSGPGTSYPIVGTLKNGDKVKIECQVKGPRVHEGFDNNLWDRIGKDQYVTDSYVYTGSDNMVVPECK